MESIEKKLRQALDSIDEAISLLREVAREEGRLAEALEEALYYLEEAGEALNTVLEREFTRE